MDVEFSYFGAPKPTRKEHLYIDIVDDPREVAHVSVQVLRFLRQLTNNKNPAS